MKHIYRLLSITCFFTLFFNCSDILEEEPQTFLNEDQVFSTESGIELAIAGLYQQFSSPNYHGASIHNIVPLSGKFFSSQGSNQDITSLNCLPNNKWVENLWSGAYSTINTANVIINNLENTEQVFSNTNIALGQAYFIRAATYFDLVRYYGGVPIRIVPITSETLHAPRENKNLVYQQIVDDFEHARTLLPNPGDYLVDRPVKTAVNAYLCKVYLTIASETNNLATWQKAYDEGIDVIGQYSLVPTYADLFDNTNQNSSESIFEIQYGQNGAVTNSDAPRLYMPKDYFQSYNTFGRIRPNKEVYDQHLNQYPSDPRIDVTFLYNSYTKWNGNSADIYPIKVNSNDGFTVLKKYVDPNYNGVATSINLKKLRYADVLLMMAEITNELNGGPTTEAYNYVNEVLARARNTANGVTTEPADFSSLSQEQFRTRILRERQYEMLGENHEFFDTRRRGYQYFLEEVIETHNNFGNLGNKDYTYPFSVKNMLLPIPSAEISGNQLITQADQNPGY